MKWMKRSTFRLTMGIGLVLVVFTCLIFTVFRQSQRNLRLGEAVNKGDEAQVKALLANGADPNARNQRFYLTLNDMVRLVCHIDYHQETYETTVVMRAACGENDRILESLLKAGGDVHETAYGITPLIFAVQSRRPRSVELLIQHGADLNCSGQLTTPLIMATTRPFGQEEFRTLLAHGANLNGHNKDGETPLMCAAGSGSPENILVVLHAGANINLRDFKGKTALRWAVDSGNSGTVTTLLNAGADITLRDQDGKTAEHIAAANAQKDIALLIRNYRLRNANQ